MPAPPVPEPLPPPPQPPACPLSEVAPYRECPPASPPPIETMSVMSEPTIELFAHYPASLSEATYPAPTVIV